MTRNSMLIATFMGIVIASSTTAAEEKLVERRDQKGFVDRGLADSAAKTFASDLIKKWSLTNNNYKVRQGVTSYRSGPSWARITRYEAWAEAWWHNPFNGGGGGGGGSGSGGAGVRTGKIHLNNNYSGGVKIRLYHANSPGRVFATWDIPASKAAVLSLNNSDMIIGGDWQIEVVFGNGVTSHRRTVQSIGTHNGNWHVDATRIFNG